MVELLYDAVWKLVRAGRHHLPLEDELLWHCVYERYIETLPEVGRDAGKTALIEAHLRIVGPIAGQIARKRCPKSFGAWSNGELERELAAFGVFGLFVAADRYDPGSGFAFCTYANPWIKKFSRLYLEEIISSVPRTGDMGDGQPRRSVMDLVNAALEHRKLYRGKAAGGTTFDSYLAPDAPDDEEAEGEEPKRPAETAQVSLTYEIGVSVEFTRGKREAPWELEGCPSGFDPKNISVAGTRYGCLKRWSKPVIGDYPLRVEKSPPRLPNTHWIMTDRGWRRGSLNQRPTIEDESYEAEEVQPEYELQIA